MADGSVTITVNTKDAQLKDLQKQVQNLIQAFNDLANIDPFQDVGANAQKATQSIVDTEQRTAELASKLGDVDGESFEDVSSSAIVADKNVDSMSDSVSEASSNLTDVDGEGFGDVSDASLVAASGVDLLSDSTVEASHNIADIDGASLYDVDSAAATTEIGIDEMSESVQVADDNLADLDGSGLYDVAGGADVAGASLDDAGDSASKAKEYLDDIDGKGIEEADQKTQQFSFSLKDIATGAAVVSAVTTAFDILTGSLDDAISRFDTLEVYPRTMQLIGFSADDAEESTARLADGIEGLPTKLDDVVSTAQRLSGMTRDIDRATDITLALNNAFLASGASIIDTTRGTEQYIQMLSTGTVNLRAWRTLSETMNYAMIELAESFGFTGPSALNDLYGALKQGEISFDTFTDKLIELSEEQDGFADLAQTNSQTIETALTNLQTAVSRNVADIIKKFDDLSYAITGNSIAQNLTNLKFVIDDAFSAIGTAIDISVPIVEGLIFTFESLLTVMDLLSPVLVTAASLFAAFAIVKKVTAWYDSFTLATHAMTVAFQANTAAQAVKNAMDAEGAIFTKALATAYGLMTGAIDLSTLSTNLLTGATTALKVALGPIAWIIGGIAAIGTTLYKVFGRTSEEVEIMTYATEKNVEATQEMSSAMQDSSKEHEKALQSIEAQTESVRSLYEETIALSEQEFVSAGDKKLLKDNTDELNEAFGETLVLYDEENESIVASNEVVEARIEMLAEENKQAELRERTTEITEELTHAEEQLRENQVQLKEAQEELDEAGGNWFWRNQDLIDVVEELEEENQELTATVKESANEQEAANEQMKESSEAYAEAEKTALEDVRIAYEMLSDEHKEIVDTMAGQYEEMVEHNRNAFSKIAEDSETSGKEMIENLEHNNKMTEQFGEQRAELMEIASKEGNDGFMAWLEELSPDSAAELNEVYNMSDSELEKFTGLLGESGENAANAFSDSLGEGKEDIANAVVDWVDESTETLNAQIESADFESLGFAIPEGVSKGIDEGKEGAKKSSKDMAKGVDEAFAGELLISSPSQKFVQHGQDIISGLTKGITANGKQAVQALNNVAKEMEQSFNTSLKGIENVSNISFKQVTLTISREMRQMSTVMRTESQRSSQELARSMTQMNQNITQQYQVMTRNTQSSWRLTANVQKTALQQMNNNARTGTNSIVMTLTNGFNKVDPRVRAGLARAVTSTRTMMNQVVNIMNGTSNRAYSAGYNTGIGFRNGLSATRGSIFAQARSIANTVVSTLRSALRIKSPSQITEGIGEDTGEGLSIGIGNKIRGVEQMAEKMAAVAVPSVSLPHNLGIAGAGVGAHSTHNTTNESAVNIDYINVEDGEDLKETMIEMGWIAEGEGDRLE